MNTWRIGRYGDYYGSYWGESVTLTYAQMAVNATYIYKSLTAAGWTIAAISGLLGNLQHESAINPGRWQSDDVGNTSMGYSLVQWTPSTVYTEWCAAQGLSDPSIMENALARILYEVDNGLQYYSTPGYPESFQEFTQSDSAPYYLACAFAWNYERSWTVLYGTEAEKEALRQQRGNAAESWYTYLTGQDPTPPPTPGRKNKRKGYNFLLFGKKAWRNPI